MRLVITGSKHFGETVYRLARGMGHEVVFVSVPDPHDRLALAAIADRVPVGAWGAHDWGAAAAADLILAAHSFEIVPASALAAARLGGVGYHPSLLPRHRGRNSVADALAAGDGVTGGTVYWLSDRIDAGDILAQDRVEILPTDDAASLWRRALAPMGVAMLARALLDVSLGRAARMPQFDGVGCA